MTTEPAITPELVKKHNLTADEYAKILELLGREPSCTELGIFSVMWSEHCSYKNTRPLLKTFPTKSPKILVGAGEQMFRERPMTGKNFNEVHGFGFRTPHSRHAR